jgi:hypothetical protein
MTEGLVGEMFGREYRTRAFMAGKTLIDRREMFCRGLNNSLPACVAGATRDTLKAESRGLIPPIAGSSLKACSGLSQFEYSIYQELSA